MSRWGNEDRVDDAVTIVRHGETDKDVLGVLREMYDWIDTDG